MSLPVQLYLPPDSMLNKDFLRDILQDKKRLMRLADVKSIIVPKYDELSVKAMLPAWRAQPDFWVYFPDQLAKDRLPDRAYFFTIMNSLHPEYVAAMIKYAQQLRFTGQQQEEEGQSIVMANHWVESLQALPFVSRKNSNCHHPCREARQDRAPAQGVQQACRQELQAPQARCPWLQPAAPAG